MEAWVQCRWERVFFTPGVAGAAKKFLCDDKMLVEGDEEFEDDDKEIVKDNLIVEANKRIVGGHKNKAEGDTEVLEKKEDITMEKIEESIEERQVISLTDHFFKHVEG